MPIPKAPIIVLVLESLLLMPFPAAAQTPQTPNQIVGTWRMTEARIDPEGENKPAYGTRPSGMLVFTPDMHYVEVLTNADIPRFASNARGGGTDAENRAVMSGSIGQFGTYTVDEAGAFSGDRVEGATFPNWVGDVRTRKELKITVEKDRMTESFQRPDGTRIAISYERVR